MISQPSDSPENLLSYLNPVTLSSKAKDLFLRFLTWLAVFGGKYGFPGLNTIFFAAFTNPAFKTVLMTGTTIVARSVAIGLLAAFAHYFAFTAIAVFCAAGAIQACRDYYSSKHRNIYMLSKAIVATTLAALIVPSIVIAFVKTSILTPALFASAIVIATLAGIGFSIYHCVKAKQAEQAGKLEKAEVHDIAFYQHVTSLIFGVFASIGIGHLMIGSNNLTPTGEKIYGGTDATITFFTAIGGLIFGRKAEKATAALEKKKPHAPTEKKLFKGVTKVDPKTETPLLDSKNIQEKLKKIQNTPDKDTKDLIDQLKAQRDKIASKPKETHHWLLSWFFSNQEERKKAKIEVLDRWIHLLNPNILHSHNENNKHITNNNSRYESFEGPGKKVLKNTKKLAYSNFWSSRSTANKTERLARKAKHYLIDKIEKTELPQSSSTSSTSDRNRYSESSLSTNLLSPASTSPHSFDSCTTCKGITHSTPQKRDKFPRLC